MIGQRFLPTTFVTCLSACLAMSAAACGGDTAPLAITPHAIVVSERPTDGGASTHILVFDVPVGCDAARYLVRGAPEGARFKAVLGVREWRTGPVHPARVVLFDAKGPLSTTAAALPPRTGSWATFELLAAPRAKGGVARLRGSASGAFTIYETRPMVEEEPTMVVSASEPDRQELSFDADIDVTVCSDIVDTK